MLLVIYSRCNPNWSSEPRLLLLLDFEHRWLLILLSTMQFLAATRKKPQPFIYGSWKVQGLENKLTRPLSLTLFSPSTQNSSDH